MDNIIPVSSRMRPLWDWGSLPIQRSFSEPEPSKKEAAGQPVNPFTDIFHTAIEAVKETDAEKNDLEYLMATGQLDNPSELLIAANKAQLSVNMLVQLRTRAMDAYNELMRINV